MKTNGFRDWALTAIGVLAVAGVLGGVKVYASVKVLENESSNLKEDISDIKDTVDRIEGYLTKR